MVDAVVGVRSLVHVDVREDRDYVDAVGGGKIVCQRYQHPTAGWWYWHWITKYRDGVLQRERKRLVSDAHTAKWGGIEPIAFVHAVRDRVLAGDEKFLTNPRANPTAEQVTEQIHLHREAFERILEHYPMV